MTNYPICSMSIDNVYFNGNLKEWIFLCCSYLCFFFQWFWSFLFLVNRLCLGSWMPQSKNIEFLDCTCNKCSFIFIRSSDSLNLTFSCRYDTEAMYFDEDVRTAKRQQLESEILKVSYSFLCY